MSRWNHSSRHLAGLSVAVLGVAMGVFMMTRDALARPGRGLVMMPGSRAGELPAKKYHGGHSAVVGDWEPCDDKGGVGTATGTKLTVAYDPSGPVGKKVSLTPATDAQVANVYAAAFATCFMSDYDPKGPTGSINSAVPEYQHDEKIASGTGGSKAQLRFRPSMQVPKMKLQQGEGYVAADIFNMSLNAKYVFPDGTEILPLHSVIFWIGMDASGQAYSAVIDLGRFPDLGTGGKSTVRLVSGGSLLETKLANDMKRPVAFARFSEPSHLLTSPKTLPVKGYIPEGSWVGCQEGCCLATGISLLTGHAAPFVRAASKPMKK